MNLPLSIEASWISSYADVACAHELELIKPQARVALLGVYEPPKRCLCREQLEE